MALLSRRFLSRRSRPRLVVVGGNFSGLAAARALESDAVQVTVIDPSSQVEWLPNIHELLSRSKQPAQLVHDRRTVIERLGHDFLQEAVSRIDRHHQRVQTSSGQTLDYDALILATGGVPHDFGVPGVEAFASATKSVDACQRIGNALTRLAALPGARPVVIVGGGIEGIEMLGEILRRFGNDNRLQLHLVDSAPRLFARFRGLHTHLLSRMGGSVTVHAGRRVVAVEKDSVLLDDGNRLHSRLTLWTAGARGHPLPAEAGLCADGEHVAVNAGLQSRLDPHIFVTGDAANLPVPLEKQAYHALDMGRHAALSVRRFLAGKSLPDFVPRPKPALVSFGSRDAFMFFGDRALASPSLLALKEAVYQYGYHGLMPPRSRHELSSLVRDLRHGLNELDTWRLLLGSTEARLFQAR
ncbi:MAG: FAD-dependent oxidoreductase [Moraxellaceae bacterium]|nr:FAD-dependent oxidoreductase [Moraxellaceae bacterium]